jgi:hypothetical protein
MALASLGERPLADGAGSWPGCRTRGAAPGVLVDAGVCLLMPGCAWRFRCDAAVMPRCRGAGVPGCRVMLDRDRSALTLDRRRGMQAMKPRGATRAQPMLVEMLSVITGSTSLPAFHRRHESPASALAIAASAFTTGAIQDRDRDSTFIGTGPAFIVSACAGLPTSTWSPPIPTKCRCRGRGGYCADADLGDARSGVWRRAAPSSDIWSG